MKIQLEEVKKALKDNITKIINEQGEFNIDNMGNFFYYRSSINGKNGNYSCFHIKPVSKKIKKLFKDNNLFSFVYDDEENSIMEWGE